MKTTLIPRLFLVAYLASAPYAFGQNAFPATAMEASQLGIRAELSQEILVLRQQHAGLKAEVERYGQDAIRLKRELELAEKTQKESAASIASLNASISILSAQEKALAAKLAAGNERDGNLTVRVRTLAQELDSLQIRTMQEKTALETITADNAKEVSRLSKETEGARLAHAASLAELNKLQQEALQKHAAQGRAESKELDDSLAAKKLELAGLDTKAASGREEQNRKANEEILQRQQIAAREAEELMVRSRTEAAALQMKVQDDMAARSGKLENDEKTAEQARKAADKTAVEARQLMAKSEDEELARRRAAVTKQLDALEAEAVQGKKDTAVQISATREKMLKDVQDEVSKTKNQTLSQSSDKLIALNKQLRDTEAKIKDAEAKAKTAETREQQADAKLAQLATQTEALEARQAQLKSATAQAKPAVSTSAPANAAALSQKAALEQEILQMRRQLDGLKSDDLAKQIRQNMIPEKK